jgi:hypothetical protein
MHHSTPDSCILVSGKITGSPFSSLLQRFCEVSHPGWDVIFLSSSRLGRRLLISGINRDDRRMLCGVADLHGHFRPGIHRERVCAKRRGHCTAAPPTPSLAAAVIGCDLLLIDCQPAHHIRSDDNSGYHQGRGGFHTAVEERQHLGGRAGQDAPWSRVRFPSHPFEQFAHLFFANHPDVEESHAREVLTVVASSHM